MKRRPSFDDALTPRERDCLRLLGQGLSTADVATDLGIRKSTLEFHLAAARRKLSVSTTRQAVVALFTPKPATASTTCDSEWPLLDAAEPDRLAADAGSALAGAVGLNDGWNRLVRHVATFGAVETTIGVIAEPEGTFSIGGRLLRSTFLQPNVTDNLAEPPDMANNPIGSHFAHQQVGRLFDCEECFGPMSQNVNPVLRSIALAFLEQGRRYHYCQPGRDPVTTAPYVLFFSLDHTASTDIRKGRSNVPAALQAVSEVMWRMAQEHRWLAGYAGLTGAQTAALKLLARGFSMAEAAEHCGVSQRGFDKVLAAARTRLDARTNAQALFRAMVYRAF